jgi:hypothetical protein
MYKCRQFLSGAFLLLFIFASLGRTFGQGSIQSDPPGIVITHSTSDQTYLGSPSIVQLPSGDLLASHDFFGPGAVKDGVAGHTRYFVSSDKGLTWMLRSTLNGMYWSNLFIHRGALYAFGTRGGVNDCIIRRSDDEGRTWTDPSDERSGLLLRKQGDMGYHCAPMPMAFAHGRIWRAMEYTPDKGWGKFQSLMLSADTSADLLDARSWRISNRLAFDAGSRTGPETWLEGNAILGPDGQMYNMLRVHDQGDDVAAMVRVSEDGSIQRFDPYADFIRLPGACKKFVIRYDAKSRRYWTLSNYAPKAEKEKAKKLGHRLERARNTLVLSSSADLRQWESHTIVAYSPDIRQHGFQYADWQFDGKDIIAAVRTAFGVKTHGSHDANYVTFHRIRGFRKLRHRQIQP